MCQNSCCPSAAVPSAGQTPGTLCLPSYPALLYPIKEEGGWCSILHLGSLCYFGYASCFPFLKGCLLSGTHHFQVSTLPASSRLLDAASSSLRTPRHASFLFSQDRREAELGGWQSRKQNCGPFSWKAPNPLPLQPPSPSCANSWLTEILKCHQEPEKAKGKCLFEVAKMK